ncbi:hypothetical protein ABFU56_08825 [Xanthomonas campestris pv. campestris]|jgi:glycerol dehydrogenase-like iron-containing ADH family enzyme|uniref:hypothetical protein n=1 Tax=Xanthomonas campestris TaxID=339 RepID=UPI0005DB8199|nr:hypothetical protein [Xanthomonas campestris]MCC5052037.1 hypothetical protein [Xanthomonas campestris pv. aberrans]MDM7683104.1 hypothetical protein [Xanthomonas campestris pv. campestris]MDM7709171.1 hypothetical protein [Xanthomonas campestris pv. campestris]MDM7729337.1 hypothetical protein [Xanthomonas campestris pv. campestris]MDO0858485.1 hypothetical protein [Xanthomonas campestris pv. campestris]
MQQQTGTRPATATRLLALGTGPGPEATTPIVDAYDRSMGDCSATITMHVTHGAVVVTATLNMGPLREARQTWERRRGTGTGWKLIDGPRLWTTAEDRISTELAEFMDGLDFPFDLANMLPRRPTAAAAAAVAQAAREVAHG